MLFYESQPRQTVPKIINSQVKTSSTACWCVNHRRLIKPEVVNAVVTSRDTCPLYLSWFLNFHYLQKIARFTNRSEQEVENLLKENDAKSTKKATKHSVTIPRKFCQKKGMEVEFEKFLLRLVVSGTENMIFFRDQSISLNYSQHERPCWIRYTGL